MRLRLLLIAVVACFASHIAYAQVEVPMTPTPAPTSTPVIAPIPNFPEKPAATPSPADSKVRIDRAGMFGAGLDVGNTSTGASAKLWFGQDVATQFSVGSGPSGNNLRFQLDLLYSPYRFDAEE